MKDKKYNDALGDRLKNIEQAEAGRKANHLLPLMARLDGKAFHTFTRGLRRPFDPRLSELMIETTKYLVDQTHAKLGYTQSDEITLFWNNPLKLDEEFSYSFSGKFQKLTSVYAGIASAFFTKNISEYIPEKSNSIAVFDCRAWNIDDMYNVFLNYLWRQDDAIKNSISMAAQAHFCPNQLDGVNSETKKQMLRDIGHPWEDNPAHFKLGTFIQRVTREIELTREQLEKIPEKHRPRGPVFRSFVEDINLGYIKNNNIARDLFGD